ncbi:hypothetical protein [Streptacidiphilus sp. MAP12-20]|uniref:hypothetical protein n=1 Tax=Streptacidiphilus sp. MAP12-20 TaxID=3156299 RepID=UPI00351480AE
MYTAEEDDFDAVFEELAGCIFHQGSLYSATAVAVPFLAHAAVNLEGKRDHALFFLVMLADEASRGADQDQVAARRAVEAELPELLGRCLADADTEVRCAAVRLAASAVGPAPAWIVEALELTYESDAVPRVRADALTALALLLPGDSREASRRVEALRSEWPEIRLAAALLDLGTSAAPYPPVALSVIARDGSASAASPALPFPNAPEERLTELLLADPEGALRVAQQWVAAGDAGGRGSWLARDLVHAWRGVEGRVVALLLEAFPKQVTALSVSSRISDAAFWMPYAGPQSEEVRQLLLREATHSDSRMADAAIRALAGMGDLTILEERYDASSWALAILLVHHREAARPHMDAALARAFKLGRVGALLTAALRPGDASGMAAEIKELLRTPSCQGVAAGMLAAGLLPRGEVDVEIFDLLASGAAEDDVWRSTSSAVALAVLTGDAEPALALITPLLRQASLKDGLLRHVGRLGPLGTPLLGDLRKLLERSDLTGAAAAEAYWRIAGDAEAVLPALTRLTASRRSNEPTLTAIQALSTLADIGRLPEQLRSEMAEIAFNRRRVTSTGGPVELPHRDERMRRAARRLLSLEGK